MAISKVSKQAAIVLAVASLGIAVLTGCTGTSKAEPKTLTAKQAGAYFVSTTCTADVTTNLFDAAITSASQAKSDKGPELDNLDAAAQAYLTAVKEAATELAKPKAAWPKSVQKSIKAVRAQFVAEEPTLETLAGADLISDAADAFSNFPHPDKLLVAEKAVRAKLGLPSITSPKACPPPAPLTAAPATGVLIKGTGYSFNAPAGWAPPQRAVQADAYAVSPKADAKGFYDTINVQLGDPVTDPLDVFEMGSVQYLEQAQSATNVAIRPRIAVAGSTGVHMSSVQTHQGHAEWSEQFMVTRNGTGYTITFAFDPAESQSAREALFESVLASWKWR